jgi:hypothetical protein
MKKTLKIIFQNILHFMPVRFRDEIIRRSVQLPENLSNQLIFKIAETTDELEAAFQLVYENYLPLGYCSENPFQLRATIHHALPTTTTLIAADSGQVVGTLTIVRDNCLGLPLEKKFDVKSLRKNSKRLAEITSLSIHKNYRRQKGGQILFPLLRLMYQYSTSYFGVNHLLVAIHPKQVHFYKSLLLFQGINKGEVQDYFGTPAIALQLNLNEALVNYENNYSRRNISTNLYHFFVQKRISNILMPARNYHKINDPVVTFDYFQNVFLKQIKLNLELTELRLIYKILKKPELRQVQTRIEVDILARFGHNTFKIKDVSTKGFRAHSHLPFTIQQRIQIEIEVAPNLWVKIEAHAIWSNPDHDLGFQILKTDEKWIEYIQFLYDDQFGISA